MLLPALAFLLAGAPSCSQAAPRCADLARLVNTAQDSSAALGDCLARLAPGERLPLAPGAYTLGAPLVIKQPVTIFTRGLPSRSGGCATLPANTCATLVLRPKEGLFKNGQMPVEVLANQVTFDHVAIRGGLARDIASHLCKQKGTRPLGGGLRISGSRFTLTNSSIKGIACYSALEIVKGADAPTIEANVIGPNGDHRPGEIWSDGVTVTDTKNASVRRNLFFDNTDVQLIFGGCRDCRVEDNRFRHSGQFQSGSFAELMIHAWPSTSGDYRGTVVTHNDIDCGPDRRCGFGIQIGSVPWYKGRASGGQVIENKVANAMIGLNIDALSGPMVVEGNVVNGSGGRFASDCGTRVWPAVNVGPGSRRFVRGDPSNMDEGSVSTSSCLLNRQPR